MLTQEQQTKAMDRLKPVESMPGYSGMTTCARLYECARCVEPDGLNLEIGSLYGKTAVAIAYGLEDRNRGDRLICIDPFEAPDGEQDLAGYLKAFEPMSPYERFWRTVIDAGVKDRVDLVVARSQDPQCRVTVNGPVRFAFIDGDHRYEQVRADAEWVLSLIRPGGVMVFDDYGCNENRWGVTQVVDDLVRPRARRQLYTEDSQSCVFFEMEEA